MRLEGSEEFNKTIVASGPNSSKPHHWPTDRKLEAGDFVTMDYGCTYNGYHSDLTRTVVIGHASDKQRRIYETVYEAQKAARERLTAGLISKEADAMARNIIDGTEFKGTFLHNLGHGIGLDIHEGTGLIEGSDAVLEAGMVVSIEPGIYKMQRERGTSIIIISHDMGAVASIAKNVAVMYGGLVVESGTAEDIFYRHEHPYTKGLLDSVPKAGLT